MNRRRQLVKKNRRKNTTNEWKRVDDLLKSTMDTLESIKHEPEVQLEVDETNIIIKQEKDDEHDDNGEVFDDINFQNDCDSDNSEEKQPSSVVDKEINQPANQLFTMHNIKKEKLDAELKKPVLKLKIKNQNGKLNSSLVEDITSNNKKLKKRKKEKETKLGNPETFLMPQPGLLRIKTEPIEQDAAETTTSSISNLNSLNITELNANVMTAIPLPLVQFQITSVAGGVDFIPALRDATEEAYTEDVKPNRAELDKLLGISKLQKAFDSITSNLHSDITETSKIQKTIPIKMPQIVSVSSGVSLASESISEYENSSLPQKIQIKSEPFRPDYDENTADNSASAKSYINNAIDMNCVPIKQEPDIEIGEEMMADNTYDFSFCNEKSDSDSDAESNEDQNEFDSGNVNVKEEPREYRDFEWPPSPPARSVETAERSLLEQSNSDHCVDNIVDRKSDENLENCLNVLSKTKLKITNVMSIDAINLNYNSISNIDNIQATISSEATICMQLTEEKEKTLNAQPITDCNGSRQASENENIENTNCISQNIDENDINTISRTSSSFGDNVNDTTSNQLLPDVVEIRQNAFNQQLVTAQQNNSENRQQNEANELLTSATSSSKMTQEEKQNLMNETTVADAVPLESQNYDDNIASSSSSSSSLNSSNINEIAENNNNANIECEQLAEAIAIVERPPALERDVTVDSFENNGITSRPIVAESIEDNNNILGSENTNSNEIT